MTKLHFTFLNVQYHLDVWQSWVSGGCNDEVHTRLGYRLELLEGARTEIVKPGGNFRVALTVRNNGFAAVINPRAVELVLRNATTWYALALPTTSADPRRFTLGVSTALSASLKLPNTIAAGTYTLALSLPNPAAALHARDEYAIRLANTAAFIDGATELGQITVSASAPSSADPAALPLVAASR